MIRGLQITIRGEEMNERIDDGSGCEGLMNGRGEERRRQLRCEARGRSET